MSSYSWNFARRLSGGRSMYSRTPASTSPESLNPPSIKSSAAPALAVPAQESNRSAATAATRAIASAFMAVSSPGEGESRRVVGAVDVHVAVQARLAQDELLGADVTSVRARRVARFDVALLTESRLGDFQHALMVRAVRIVTVAAALVDGCVHPQERSTLVGVTSEASRVRPRLLQERE